MAKAARGKVSEGSKAKRTKKRTRRVVPLAVVEQLRKQLTDNTAELRAALAVFRRNQRLEQQHARNQEEARRLKTSAATLTRLSTETTDQDRMQALTDGARALEVQALVLGTQEVTLRQLAEGTTTDALTRALIS